MIIKLLFFLVGLVPFSVFAQLPVGNNYPFKSGVYTSFNEFSADTPTLDSIFTKMQYDLNAEENILILKPASQSLLDSLTQKKIWGLCLNNVPYIKTDDKQEGRPYFVKLHVIGKLSYYYYKAFREKEVIMYVHNPYTGERIGKKTVTNRDLVFIQKLLHFQSGENIDFNFDNFKSWTADDKGLQKSLSEMSGEERESKLFKTLLIYNDRNPVYPNKKTK
jgi:hypothetical protein